MNDGNVKMGVYTRDGEETSFNFRTSLRAKDKVRFVKSVVGTLVGDDYLHVLKGLIFDYYIIDIFTDVDTSEVPQAIDAINAIEDIVIETNIVEIVKANAEAGLIEELEKAVELDIEYRTGIHSDPIAESLSSLLNKIEEKIEGFDLDSLMGAADALSGISGEFTPDKMLEAFANTDIFKKKQRREIAEELITENVTNTLKDNENVVATPILSPSFEV